MRSDDTRADVQTETMEGGARGPAATRRRDPRQERRPGAAFGRVFGATGALLLLLATAAGTARAQATTGDGDALAPERLTDHRGFPVVEAARTPEAIGDAEVRGARLITSLGGERLELTAGSPFYRLGARVGQLANAPYQRDGEFWIPAELFEGGTGPVAAGEGAGEAFPERSRPWRVTIDPGHGGRDPGAHGPRGTREKEVVLAISRRIARRLSEHAGIEARLTRDDDTFIPLAERSRMAVEDSADLFVSVHANANRSRRPRGFETYFLSPARTEESRQVAMRENSAVEYEAENERPDMSDINYIWAANDQSLNVVEASYFAGRVQNELRGRVSAPDRGVKQAGFYVLMGASGVMPAVLVETGFLSNPVEERFLGSADGQEEIAAAVADAVVTYFQQREQRLASGSPE